MRLNSNRLERLQRSLELALNQEWPRLVRTKRHLLGIRPMPIRSDIKSAGTFPVVATVATDGGENRLNLDPIRVQVLRVADSTGEVYFEDFIPLSLQPEEILRFYFKSEPRLQKFLEWLGCDWGELLPRTDYQRGSLLAMLRELLEWAALLKLASKGPAKLLIRDGLLRSILLNEPVFLALRRRLEHLTKRHGHLLVGIAKRSKVINYLTLAFGLNETFASGQPSYLVVPGPLEREATPEQYRWIGERAMGQLYVARLDAGDGVPLFPVDVAAWQRNRAAEIMALLHESASGSFPLRGYPNALVRAHEHARLGALETEIFEQLLLEVLAARDPKTAQQAHFLKLIGRRLIEEPTHDELIQA